MANDRARVAIVLSSATIWAVGCIWLVFHPTALEALVKQPIFAVALACFSVVSVYFCYFVARRQPGFELGLTVLAISFALLTINGIASFVLNIQNFWTDAIEVLNRVLLPLSAAILFWQGLKKSKEGKRKQIKKSATGE